jgi:hypothetical protein
VIAPAAAIALPWYARDIAIYGWPDFLGLIRHDAIVAGQTRTAEFIAQVGWSAYWQRAVEFTFKSFWGVFGWLGVFMDSRVYFALAVLSGAAAVGLVLRWVSGKSQYAVRSTPYVLLTLSTLLTLLVYAWYNTQFVQHQGRYLFTALIPIALAFAAGWDVVSRPHVGRWLAVALGGFGIGLAVWGVVTGHGLPKWPLAITAVFASGLAVADLGQQLLSHRSRRAQHAAHIAFLVLPFVALPPLALYGLFGAIVPQLSR